MTSPAHLLDQINQQYCTSYVLLDRYSTGEQGAYALVDTNGARFVLKWSPDNQELPLYQRAQRVTQRLRRVGYPAPVYALLGCTTEGAFMIQHALPGQPLTHLPLAILPDFVNLIALQAGMAETDGPAWPAPVVQPVLTGGDGFCLLKPMQTYSTASAALLQALQQCVRRYASEVRPATDIVHYDYNPRNVLVEAGAISGVVDWEGWCCGDRMFDVATMLFYNYTSLDIRNHLWQVLSTESESGSTAVYLAHLIHRQVDWTIRHHDQGTINQWLSIATQVLNDLPP